MMEGTISTIGTISTGIRHAMMLPIGCADRRGRWRGEVHTGGAGPWPGGGPQLWDGHPTLTGRGASLQ